MVSVHLGLMLMLMFLKDQSLDLCYSYINDLSNGLKSACKLFADDNSLFSVVNNINTSASDFDEDLEKIGNWAFKWKMNFNPDPNKQAQGIIFSRKKTTSLHPVIFFDNKPVKSTQIHKHLGMILDWNLSYEHHFKSILNKVNKAIGLLRKFQLILPRHSLITIYKAFIRPHLDYGDVIYDRAFNESFHQRLESIQYNAAIAITGTIRRTSSEKLFQELGLETLKSRRWFRKLYLFYKILHSKSPSYLFNLIPENNNPYASRSALNNQIPFFNVKANFLKNSFFPAVITEWNNLDISIRNSSSCHIFKNLILKFIRPKPNRISSTQNFEGLKLLTRMRLVLSHLADPKFRHNFQDCLNPICSCGQVIETTGHFLLHCLNYRCARKTFFEIINLIDSNILK